MFDLIVKMQSLVSAANNLGCGGEHCPTQWGVNASQPRYVLTRASTCLHAPEINISDLTEPADLAALAL